MARYLDINNDPRPPLPRCCEYCDGEGRYRAVAQEVLCAECFEDWMLCHGGRKGESNG